MRNLFLAVTAGLFLLPIQSLAQSPIVSPTSPSTAPLIDPCKRSSTAIGAFERSLSNPLKTCRNGNTISLADLRTIQTLTVVYRRGYTEGDYAGMPMVKKLFLYHADQIDDAFFRELSELTELEISANRFNFSVLKTLAQLKILRLRESFSSSSTLPGTKPFFGFSNLETLELNLSPIRIDALFFEGLSSLKTLKVTGWITSLDGSAFSTLPQLRELIIGKDAEAFGTVAPEVLTSLGALEVLVLKIETNSFPQDLFKGSPNLKILDLGTCTGEGSKCLPQGLLEGLSKLETFTLRAHKLGRFLSVCFKTPVISGLWFFMEA